MRLLPVLSICIFLTACITPTELLLKGDTYKAFRKAQKKLKNGKDIMANTDVIVDASDEIAKNTIYYNMPYVQSNQLKDWTRAQKIYDKSLRELFSANDLVNGKLQSSYDLLCTEKIELDFKVTNHFYQLGEDLLATHYERLSKHHAREAYYEYQECLAYGGDRFFQDVDDKMEECVTEGRIYFVSNNFKPRRSIFFQALPQELDQEPDCVIYADFGHPHFSENSSCSTKNFSEKIKAGVRTEVDTAGTKHCYPIYKEINGSVTTTKVTISACITTYINAENITGYCYKNSRSFRSNASDSYDIVTFSGDHRAIPSCYSEKRGSHSHTKWQVERELDSQVDSDLYHW